ncbi:MAG TPA: oxygenase MpaB family protein [Dehalococcoidia bacterium]|nr:oxygenase MpaB family protein [Dehalococcoidia bacterium]
MSAAVDASLNIMFTDASAVRRIHDEGILLIGGGRALLMQLAHPLVARGVTEHSSFRRERMQRLLRTLRPMLAIAYGTQAQAAEAATSINRTHDRVHGVGYDAHDPELLLWVMATLIDTTLVMHRLFARPFTQGEGEAYYRDTQFIGEALGIPREVMPPDLPAFEAYVRSQVASLQVSDEARAIANDLFRWWPPHWAVMWPLRQLTAGLLPAELRSQYGTSWGPRRQRALELLASASRRALPYVPHRIRRTPRFLLPPATSA